jgi:CHASE3 domain sensor protein
VTSLTPNSAPSDRSMSPDLRPAVSAAEVKEHSDERFNNIERRAAQEASMMRTRWLTIAGVVVLGLVIWVMVTR